MVTRIIAAAVVGLATLSVPSAHAHRIEVDDDPEPPDHGPLATDDEPGFNMFGFMTDIGVQPIDGVSARAVSLGLGVEHPVFTKTRVFGEYAWVWLTPGDDARALMSTLPRPEREASGQRVTLGLRRELAAKPNRSLRMFLDGELGASAALLDDTVTGSMLVPAGFVGLRGGYDIYSDRDESPSRMFEAAFLLRATGTQDGVGLTFGLGLAWGN